jgi:UDP-perosamine 4-acetyltransferase
MDVVIIGAGGHGKSVLDIFRSGRARGTKSAFNVVGFIDANPALHGTTVAGLPVLGPANRLPKLKSRKIGGAIVAIGDNRARQSYGEMVRDAGLALVNAIHPTAMIAPSARLGGGIVVAAGAIVGADATVGDMAILNSGSIVEHECQIEPSAHICSGAVLAGRVHVGARAFVGMGSCIIQCLNVGNDAIIGAGAVVLADVPAGATAVGAPARLIKQTHLDSFKSNLQIRSA